LRGALTDFAAALRGGRGQRAEPAPPDYRRGLASLPEILVQPLYTRGIPDRSAAEVFLQPERQPLYPPDRLAGLTRAVERIWRALRAGEPIAIFGDYDVDGLAATALLTDAMRRLGGRVLWYIPDRQTGYGLSLAALDWLGQQGARLVVTVDCGAAANEAIAHGCAIGLKIVVIDHHMMREEPPRCLAVVNPNRPGDTSGQGNLAAAGVVFVLLAALNREARGRGMFADMAEPDIRQWLDLAAMGAICDVTALTGFNRALTRLGLKVMSDWRNPGLRALLSAAGSEPGPAKSNHAGFILGPRINAGGRIGKSDLGARLLSTDDPGEAEAIALELDALNVSRREVERAVTDQAIRRVEQTGAHADDSAVVVVAGEDWHPGVVGIVAGRLRERWRKPVIVIGIDAVNGIGKGSGRSQPGMNLGRAVQAAWETGVLMAGGGHAMAAGLTVKVDRIDELRDHLNAALAGESVEAEALDAVEIDVLIDPSGATRDLFEQFERLAPFGPANPEPTFALHHVQAREPVAMNGGHVRCRLVGPDGASVRAIAWRCADLPAGKALLSGQGGLSVVGKLKADDWNGRRGVQFEIEDVADPRMA